MAKDSIVISCLLTQSDIRNYNAHACSGMLAKVPGSLKSAWPWYCMAESLKRFKEGMMEGL